jgi:hypothetical protein
MIPTRRRRPQGGKSSSSSREVASLPRSTAQQIIQKSPMSTGGGPALINLPASLANASFSSNLNSSSQRQGMRRNHTFTSQTSLVKDANNPVSNGNGSRRGNPNSCWEYTGLNFLVPALLIWSLIVLLVWWPELKDNALDYYYLQYPEQQPLSPIPGTVLPLIPNVWFFDPDKGNKKQPQNPLDMSAGDGGTSRGWKTEVQNHLKEHRQPHYYMLPQDYYEQIPQGLEQAQARNATKIRGILVYLHPCHQSGLHFFQLPESRRVAAEAMKRGLAIFCPTASTASKLLTTNGGDKGEQATRTLNNQKGATAGGMQQQQGLNEKNCWSKTLDGDELLGPILYEWAREMDMLSLPRMAMAVSNGANLLMASSLYKTLRLQSMALYASHHPAGFDLNDLERDLIPATAFVVFPKNEMATEHAMRHFTTLKEKQEEDDLEMELRMEEENEEFERQEEEEDEDSSNEKAKPKARFFRKTQLWKVEPHPWTPSLCQERLPEYHTRCRSFFRHLKTFQDSKRRKQELKQMKLDPLKRIKRLRMAAGGLQNAKQKFQLITSVGEVLQSSKSTQWIPVLEMLGLDDWTTHTMAFTMAWDGNSNQQTQQSGSNAVAKKMRKKKSQLKQFPTTATPEGRSWLWASMLQEIEVAYGVQEMTSEFSPQILDFLMYHAGLALLA